MGTATASRAARLQKYDRIVLGDIEVKTKFDPEVSREYVNYACFDFTPAERRESARPTTGTKNNEPVPQREEEGLPF